MIQAAEIVTAAKDTIAKSTETLAASVEPVAKMAKWRKCQQTIMLDLHFL